MPLPSLNLNEYGTESGFNAPQARKFPFLGQKVSKVFAMLPFPINFALGGTNDSLGVFGGRHGPVAFLDPPMLTWGLQRRAPFNTFCPRRSSPRGV